MCILWRVYVMCVCVWMYVVCVYACVCMSMRVHAWVYASMYVCVHSRAFSPQDLDIVPMLQLLHNYV